MRWNAILATLVVVTSACSTTNYEPRLEGETCEAFEDCAQGLICAHDGICRLDGAPGTVKKNGECVATAECRIGLVCSAGGTCVEPGEPGTAGFDEACDDTSDCQLGYTCETPAGGGDTVCKGLTVPLWFGGECPEQPADTPFKVFHEVADGQPENDFYRWPYPNDARVDDQGRISLAGHPVPPVAELAAAAPGFELIGDVVGQMVSTIETGLGGRFGPNQAIFFRFSQFPEPGSLKFGLPGNGNLALVDITAFTDTDPADLPDAPSEDDLIGNAGALHPFRYEVSSSSSPYICPNWLAIHPIDGRPMLPGHTYAAVVGASIENDDGEAAAQDADFTALLADAAPSDARLTRAYEAFAPLRAWLADRSVDSGTIAGATVFTVQDTTTKPQRVWQGVQDAAVPSRDTDEPFVACGGGDDPFAASGDDSRGCTGGDPAFTELQLVVGLPQFQAGTPPFKNAGDGGAIAADSGPPSVVRVDPVHVTITVPKGVEMPEAGWPVAIYGHGTGGSYTSVIRSGFAGQHTAIGLGDETVHLAMVGFDAPLHGPRSFPANHDDAWLDVDPNAYEPDVLFFNPLNLAATRDNALQQAADTWSLVRFLGALDLAADDAGNPLGADLKFDLANLFYVGHSQGGVVGTLAVAFEPEFDALVLSGAGGLTINSLLEKTNPHDIPNGVRAGLVDPRISRVHPVLNLAQQLAEAGDGVNHARWILRNPLDGGAVRHVLQTYGIGDTYTPDSTQQALARALALGQLTNGNTPLDTNRFPVVSKPVSGNGPRGGTAVLSHYQNAGDDAHFVMFDRDDAQEHVSSFLGTAVVDGVPTVDDLP